MILSLTCYRHLLGKKSWNVYNAANIDRVKHDEEAAAAREAAEEQKAQEVDAERRIKLLRGLPVDQISKDVAAVSDQGQPRREGRFGGDRKRRKLAGEDDTDKEIRYAKEDQKIAIQRTETSVSRRPANVPLTDSKGNINLFVAEATQSQKRGNAEAAVEEAKKKKEYEDQYTMRFSNAGGFKKDIGEEHWYSVKPGTVKIDPDEVVSKDVWGNEDPRRKTRDKMRLQTDDPLAAMQRGVQGVRRVEKERDLWKKERQKEMADLEEEERRRQKRHERKYSHRHYDGNEQRLGELSSGPEP